MGEAFEHLFAPAVRERGQHLRRGQDRQRFDVLRAALGREVEFAHRVDLVVKEFDAHRRAERRVDIQNSAAQGELAHTFDRFRARVAAFDKFFRERIQLEAVTEGDLRHRAAQDVGRERALHQRVGRCDQNGRSADGKAAQRADALLLPAVGGGHAVAQLPFAREEKAHILAQQLVQVARHAVRLVFVRADDQKGALRLLPHGGGKLRAVHTRKARHGDGRGARVEREQQLAHLGQRGERFVQLLHSLCHAVSLLPQRANGPIRRGRGGSHPKCYDDII